MFDERELIYENGYKREHSKHLKDLFSINPNGVDYHNPFNVAIEFKETFAKKILSQWFKLPKKQVQESDFFVFCYHTSKYYVVDKREIEMRYDFKTYGNRANVRIGSVKSLALKEFDNAFDLKMYLDKIEVLR